MNDPAPAAIDPATGAIAQIDPRAEGCGTALAPQPSRSPARPMPTNPVIETIVSRSAAKYYDPTATLSDDRIRDLVRIGTPVAMDTLTNFFNGVFDPEKDFPAVAPAGSI